MNNTNIIVVLVVICILIIIYFRLNNQNKSVRNPMTIFRFMFDEKPANFNGFDHINSQLKDQNMKYDYEIVKLEDINERINIFNEHNKDNIKILTLTLNCAKHFDIKKIRDINNFKGIIVISQEFQLRYQNKNNKLLIQVLDKDIVLQFNDIVNKYDIDKIFQVNQHDDIPHVKEMITTILNKEVEIIPLNDVNKYKESDRKTSFVVEKMGQDTDYQYFKVSMTHLLCKIETLYN